MHLGPGEPDVGQVLVPPVRVPMRWQTVRRQFDRRAAGLTQHGFLLREIAGRLADRLDYIRLAPRRIVDVGCGAGGSRALLTARYPDAHWLGVDVSLAM